MKINSFGVIQIFCPLLIDKKKAEEDHWIYWINGPYYLNDIKWDSLWNYCPLERILMNNPINVLLSKEVKWEDLFLLSLLYKHLKVQEAIKYGDEESVQLFIKPNMSHSFILPLRKER